MPPLFIPEKTDKLLELLIPYDVRKEGGERLQERLRNLFDVGARIGHQQNAKEASVSSSLADSVSAATQTETHRSTRMSCLPSLPCLASFSTTAMQTDPPSFPETTTLPPTISMQTEVPIPTPSSHPTPSPAAPLRPSPTVHDADTDVHEAPKTPSHDLDPPSPSSLRDFSDLRTGTPHPPVTPTSNPHPSTSTLDQNLRLDWGLDPRLRDLSRALTALGWVWPGVPPAQAAAPAVMYTAALQKARAARQAECITEKLGCSFVEPAEGEFTVLVGTLVGELYLYLYLLLLDSSLYHLPLVALPPLILPFSPLMTDLYHIPPSSLLHPYPSLPPASQFSFFSSRPLSYFGCSSCSPSLYASPTNPLPQRDRQSHPRENCRAVFLCVPSPTAVFTPSAMATASGSAGSGSSGSSGSGSGTNGSEGNTTMGLGVGRAQVLGVLAAVGCVLGGMLWTLG
ncbi:hypothetical protein K438DRAFT_2010115 [Mycena galopus ATCC 62051]|nr:hypothetical protein K438DRAFT_2010115 [Mycena galopus ATCC 62051]